jgi:hypothetical protein
LHGLLTDMIQSSHQRLRQEHLRFRKLARRARASSSCFRRCATVCADVYIDGFQSFRHPAVFCPLHCRQRKDTPRLGRLSSLKSCQHDGDMPKFLSTAIGSTGAPGRASNQPDVVINAGAAGTCLRPVPHMYWSALYRTATYRSRRFLN